jgi:hypothetical protein
MIIRNKILHDASMKNWPKQKQSLLERLNIKITEKVYQYVLKKERKKGVLRRLYYNALQSNKMKKMTSSNVKNFRSDLNLKEIVYYDLFSIEELDNLEKGLSKIIEKNRWPKNSFANIVDRDNKSTPHIKNFQKSRTYGGYTRAGSAYLVNNSNFQLLDSIQIWLTNITSSYVSLTIVAKPSTKFKDEFYNLSKKTEQMDARIIFPNIKFGIKNIHNWYRFGHSLGNILDTKQRKLDELFLNANKEIVKYLRKYVKAGMGMLGPIPQIEVIGTTEPLNSIPEGYNQNATELEKQFKAYLEIIGYSSNIIKPFKNEWGYLYSARRSRYYKITAYQILSREGLNEYDNDKILAETNYLNPVLCSTLSPLIYLKFISESLFEMNKVVSATLSKETVKRISFGGLGKSIARTATINWLKFQQLRIWTEFLERKSLSWLKIEGYSFKRSAYKHEEDRDDMDFEDEVLEAMRRVKESNDAEIKYLEGANTLFLTLKNTVINNRLQLTITILTLVLLIITVLLLPKEILNSLEEIWGNIANKIIG